MPEHLSTDCVALDMISKVIKFCSWNIHGYMSRLIGNKFEDKEFLKIFEDVDFIGITET